MSIYTLPTDSAVRKDIPLRGGCADYFPAALAGVAKHSKMGNDKHNPGQPLHHARGKSMDHRECIDRHQMDISDLEAKIGRDGVTPELVEALLAEANALAWRSLAYSQKVHEIYGGAPLAPAARLPEEEGIKVGDRVKINARYMRHHGQVGAVCESIVCNGFFRVRFDDETVFPYSQAELIKCE